MTKVIVNKIKRDCKGEIANTNDSDFDNFYYQFNDMGLWSEYCYALLFREIRDNFEREEHIKSFQYLLYFNRQTAPFNYDKIFRQINDLFKGYWKIVRCLSGRKHVRILDFQSLNKFPHWKLSYMSIYLALPIIRPMHGEFLSTFLMNEKKIDNLETLIYEYYQCCNPGSAGINQNLMTFIYKNKKPACMAEIRKYLNNIKSFFGQSLKLTGPQDEIIRGYRLDKKYQSKIYTDLLYTLGGAK